MIKILPLFILPLSLAV